MILVRALSTPWRIISSWDRQRRKSGLVAAAEASTASEADDSCAEEGGERTDEEVLGCSPQAKE
jgi:hypothetical protein